MTLRSGSTTYRCRSSEGEDGDEGGEVEDRKVPRGDAAGLGGEEEEDGGGEEGGGADRAAEPAGKCQAAGN